MKKKQVKKPSKLDNLAASVALEHAHLSTGDIIRRHTVLACEQNVLDGEINALTASIADARLRRAKVEAMIRGLVVVVEKR